MSMDSIRFFPGKFRFFRCPRGADGQEGKNRVAANGMSAATRHVRVFCYAAGAATAVVSGAVSDAVSSGTVFSANFSGWLARS